MHLFTMFSRLLGNHKGTSMVMYVIALVVIAGCGSISIDIGMVVSEKTKLVNALDSAALAGGQEIFRNKSNAVNVARTYLQKNGMDPGNAEVNLTEDGNGISISSKKEVKYFFAKVLGFDKGEVNAKAVAKLLPVKAVSSGIRPFAVESQTLDFSKRYVLKDGAGNGSSGNYGALALGGSGASRFQNNIVHGYQGTLKVGDYVDTEPGNMKGPTVSGVGSLLNQCNHCPKCTFDNYRLDCPRIVTIVIVDSLDVNGRKSVKIVGFAAFYLEDVDEQGGHTQITGRFIKTIVQGELDIAQADFGLRGLKLTN